MKSARSRLIVALDVPDRTAALSAVRRLSGHVGCFKLGLEIFVSEGPRLVDEVRDLGESVFLDLKIHDIPNTAAGAVRSACRLGVQMLTIHAAGGRHMLAAAREAAETAPASPMLLAVTALTSLSEADMRSLGVAELAMEAWVDQLAVLAHEAGIRGLVASPLEIARLRTRFGATMDLVIPGIRPPGQTTQDQSRTASPAEAIGAGADYLVVGRPILQAADPARTADEIVAQIDAALSQRNK